MVRTRFAPSPTGFMHIGGLRSALYEYLIAKSNKGTFILRIEDTDQERFVEGAVDVIYSTLKTAGILHDEGPDVGGDYGPYVQSERKETYLPFALELVQKKKAYYCFCTKERLSELGEHQKYDRHCLHLTDQEIQQKMDEGVPYVIRQKMNDTGTTTFVDEVFGSITVENSELEDQVLIKSDGLPTYNFANVVDDHLMEITHVVRGSEYLPSAPKYNQLYEAFGWEIPVYVHLPLILSATGGKLSKRKGDPTFDDLLALGYLPEAVLNYVALLGWAPSGDTREFFTLPELVESFTIKGISKSPATMDTQKLSWMNGEYLKKMDPELFYTLVLPYLQDAIKRSDVDLKKIAAMVQPRVELPQQVVELVDFIDALPAYDKALFVHKKMKTTEEIAKESLIRALPVLESQTTWDEHGLHEVLLQLVGEMGIKNGQMLWPVRTALSGKPTSPCGATELAALLGKDESLKRIQIGIDQLS